MKKLLEQLVAEVRNHNITNIYTGIPTQLVGHGCELCNSEWKPGESETHAGACLIAMTDIAIEQMP